MLTDGAFWPLALASEVYACRRFWTKTQQKEPGQPAWRDWNEEILVVCNRAEQPVSLELPVPDGAGWALELLSGRETVVAGEVGLLQTLPGLSCQVWLFRSRAPQQWQPERAAGALPVELLAAHGGRLAGGGPSFCGLSGDGRAEALAAVASAPGG